MSFPKNRKPAGYHPQSTRAHKPRNRSRLLLELLEDRTLPSTNTWTGAMSNLWNVAGNWSNGIPVAGQDVTIATATNTPVLLSGTAANIDSLTSSQPINLQGTTLTLTGGGTPATGGLTFTNHAALTITSGGDLDVTTNDQTFGGDSTGAVAFGDTNAANAVTVAGGRTLTVAAGFAIDGKTGQLNGGGTIANNGTIQAQNGGTITLSDPVSGAGTITTDTGNNSQVTQSAVKITGNTISGKLVFTNTGANVLSGVTVSSTGLLIGNDAQERVTGSLTLNGEIDLNANTWLGFGVTASEALPLSGSGSIVFDANATNTISLDNSVTLTVGANVTIRGQNGLIGTPRFAAPIGSLVNNGTIQADVATGVLHLNATTTNNGTLQAKNGGTLALDSTTVTGGLLTTDTGHSSQVTQNSTTVASATISGEFAPNNSNANVLSADTVSSTGVVDVNGARTRVTSGLTLNGAIDVKAGGILGFGVPSNEQESVTTTTPGQTAGKIVFDSSAGNHISLDNGVILTVGPGITIQGQNGTIGTAQIASPTGSLVNNGVIQADVAGGTLHINAATTNAATLQALNGGTLEIDNTTVSGAGTITTDTGNNSQITQSAATITLNTISGKLFFTNTGANVLSGVTVSSTGLLIGNGAQERVTGSLTLNGEIDLNANTWLGFGVAAGEALPLSGSGSIVFDANATNTISLDNSVTLTVGANVTIRGQNGLIGTPRFAAPIGSLVNNGTIQADVATGVLHLNATTTNNGTLQAKNGGTLALDSTTVTGGLLTTDTGHSSQVTQNSTTVASATISGEFAPNNSNANVLSADTVSSTGVVDVNGARTRVTSGLTLNGAIDVKAGGILGFGVPSNEQESVTTTTPGQTAGKIVFDSSAGNHISLDNGVILTVGPGITIQGQNGTIGTAQIASPTGSLVNNGVIQADVAGGTLHINAATTNAATLQALNGGTLEIDNTTVSGAGTITTDTGNNSQITQSAATITLNTISGKLFFTNTGANVLSGVTVSSTGLLIGNGAQERVTGSLTLNGEIDLNANTWLGFGVAVGEALPLSGSGSIVFDANAGNTISLDNSVALTVGANVTIRGQNGLIGTPRFAAPIGSLVNNGTISADTGNGTLTVNPTSFTNNGKINVAAGSTVDSTGTFTNFNSGTSTLTGGTYTVAGTFKFVGANIATNAANITLDGPPSAILNRNTNGDAFINFATNAAAGLFTLKNGRTLTTPGAFTNAGALTIDATGGASKFTATGAFTQTGGTTTLVAGGTLAANANTVAIQGGTLQGTGHVTGNVTVSNAGTTIAPGTAAAAGTITIGGAGAGNLTMNNGTILTAKLTGPNTTTPTAGTDFDQVSVNGTITLNSPTLNGIRTTSYVPTVGAAFKIINNIGGATISGNFNNLAEGSTDTIGGVFFGITYKAADPNSVVLTTLAPTTVYVDDSWAGTATGADPANDPIGNLVFTYNAFSSIQAALNQVAPNGTVVVYGGTYNTDNPLNINKALQGIDVAVNPGIPGETTVNINEAVTLSVNMNFQETGVGAGAGATPANLAFGSTVDDATAGTHNLTVTGTVTFGGAVGTTALGALLVTGTTAVNTSTVTTSTAGGGAGNQTYQGTITLGAATTLTADGTSSSAAIATGGNQLTIATSGTWNANGVISGAGGLIASGTGTLILNRANNYGGATQVTRGTLQLGIDNALPAGSAVTIGDASGDHALLDLHGFNQTVPGLHFFAPGGSAATALTLGTGTLTLNGDLTYGLQGNNFPDVITATGTGHIDLNGAVRNFTINGNHNVNQGGDVQIDAPIQNGGIFYAGTPSLGQPGVLTLGAANTYTLGTTVAQGELWTTVAGALPTTSSLTLGTANSATPGVVDLRGNSQTVAGLSLAVGNTGGTNNIITTNSGTPTFTVNNSGNFTFGGALTGGLALTEAGSAALSLTGANTYSGATTVTSGTLLVDGSTAAASAVTVNGGTLGGTGTINGSVQVNSGGTLSPGDSPGLLAVGSLTMNTGSTLFEEINGLTAGTLYDQLKVNGAVNLNGDNGAGATLTGNVGNGFNPPANSQYTIVSNQGGNAVAGQFAQGGSVTISGVRFNISYTGNGGNDVVLTAANRAASNTVYVDDSWAGTTNGNDPNNDPIGGLVFGTNAFSDIQSGINAAAAGATVVVYGGTYTNNPVNVNKALGEIDAAVNPDVPAETTVDVNEAVTLTDSATFVETGVNGGMGATAANLTFGSTVDAAASGGAGLTINGSTTATFDDAVGGTTELASLMVSGNAQLNGGTVVTTGDQNYVGPVSLGSDANLFSNSGAINFHSTVDGASALTTSTATGTTFGGAVGSTTALSGLTILNGAAAINGGSIQTNGNQIYSAAVTLGSDATLTSLTGGVLSFTSTVDGPGGLTTSTTGLTDFEGAVGGLTALKNLTVNGSSGSTQINGGSIRTTSGQTYNNAVSLGIDASLTSVNGASILFSSTVDGPGGLTVTNTAATQFSAPVGGSTALASLTINGNGGSTAINGGGVVQTAGAQTYNNAVTLSQDVNLISTSNADVSFQSTVDGPGGLTVHTNGVTTLGNDVGHNAALGSLMIAAGSGSTDVNGSQVRTVDAQVYGDAVVLGHDVTMTSTGGGAITFGSTLDGGFALTTDTSGQTRFAGAVGATTPLTKLTTVAEAGATTVIRGGSVTTTGDQTFNNPVTITAGTTLTDSGTGIFFNSTVDGDGNGPWSLTTITTVAGAQIQFNGTVGGTNPLKSLTVNDAGPGSATAAIAGAATTFTKQGAGTFVLQAANTYTGATTLAAGTLQVDGSITSDVTINGGTLAGIGSTGNVTANAGAVAPGDSGPGVLSTNSISLNDASAFQADIGGATPGNGAGHYDQLHASGSVGLFGAVLDVAAFGYQPQSGDTYTLIVNGGGNTVGGNFTAGSGIDLPSGTPLPEGTVLSNNFLGSGLTAAITYVAGGGHDVAILMSKAGADLNFDTATGPTAVGESTNFTWSFAFTNKGPGAAQNVQVTDTLPAGAAYVSGSFRGTAGVLSGNKVTFSIGSVAANETVMGTITVTAAEEGTLTDSATVTSDTHDPDTSNNTSPTITTIVAESDLTVTLAPVGPVEGKAFSGTVATFTDPGSTDANTAYSATVDWGDGNITPADSIGGSNGSYTVQGHHTYTEEGPTSLRVTVIENGVAHLLTTTLTGDQQVPANSSPATGTGSILLSADQTMITVDSSFSNLTAPATAAHIHNAPAGSNGPIIFPLSGVPAATSGTIPEQSFAITPAQVIQLLSGRMYENIHDANFPGGEIRGQFVPANSTAQDITIADAPLTITALPVAATEGASFSGPVANFTDANPNPDLADYSAQIDWGDNHSTAATAIQPNGNGGFVVMGTHTYDEEGSFTVKVTVTDHGGAVAATGFTAQTNLVSDLLGTAVTTDPSLKNPWGIALSGGSPFWISDNGTGLSTLYNGAGVKQGLVVTIPPPAGSPAGAHSAPTGAVFNSTVSDFALPTGGKALFLFATEDGTLAAWNGAQGTTARLVGNPPAGAVYKGLALAQSGAASFLYAADFHNGTVDVFDKNFNLVGTPGGFTDPNLPAGYAPFGIQNIGGHVFVTYALQKAPDNHDDQSGPGNGYVDEYDANGNLIRRFASNGPLNSPWGLALAPATFGAFAGDLLVGNFGDGRINAFDPTNGNFLGPLSAAPNSPITIDGLWGLTFGNGGNGGNKNTLYFTAGLNGEADGLFGSLAAVPAGTATVADAPLMVVGPPSSTPGSPVTGTGTTGTTNALNAFEMAIGGPNNGNNPPPQGTGFRTINWDGVTLNGADFGGNTTVIDPGHTIGIPLNRFQARGVEFGDVYGVSGDGFTSVNPNAAGLFPAFSPNNTFAMFNDNFIDLSFVRASAPTGTPVQAASRGLGVVFLNVELPHTSSIEFFNGSTLLDTVYAPVGGHGQPSFVGELFDQPVVTSVHITCGTDVLFSFDGHHFSSGSQPDDPAHGHNLVATDDFVYAEPQPLVQSPSDATTPPLVFATEGKPFSGTLARFKDADPGGTASDYTATVDWGDGHIDHSNDPNPQVSVVADPNGGFDVIGTHTYAEQGSPTLTATVQDHVATVTGTDSVTVLDAQLTGGKTTINPNPNVQFSGKVASFTDSDPNGMASDYTATIAWGDGNTSPDDGQAVQIVPNGNGGFDVQGSHTYTTSGTFTVRVYIFETDSTFTAAATVLSTASVGQLDFGQAPAPYPTLLADNGARHLITGLRLGNTVIAEPDGQPSPPNPPDPDDDGITFLSPFVANGTAAIKVNVQGATANGAKLDAWIDWNHNGSWNDPGEEVAVDTTVFNGDQTITINVPAAATVGSATPTYARFRLSTAGGLAPTGLAADGEVEDYKITLSPCPSTVYVGPSYNQPPGTQVNGHTVGFDAFATIQQGVNVVCPAGTVNVAAGTYHETVSIAKPVTVQGAGTTTVVTPPSGDGIDLITGANNVTLSSLEVAGAAGAGINVQSGTATISSATLANNGTGVLLTGSAVTLTGDTLTNNAIGISVTGGTLTLGLNNKIQAGTQGRHGLLVSGASSTIANLTLNNTAFSGFLGVSGAFYAELRNTAEQGPQLIDATGATFEGTAGAALSQTMLQQVENQIYDFHVDSTVGLFLLQRGVIVPGVNVLVIGASRANTINVNGTNPANVIVTMNGRSQAGLDASKGRVLVLGGNGADYINISGPVTTEVHGGQGNSTILGGTGKDVIFGGPGNDYIVGRGTADVIVGGGGNDNIQAMSGLDVLISGSLNPGFNTYAYLDAVRTEWLDTSNTTKAMLHDLAAHGVSHPDTAANQSAISHSGGRSAFIYRKTGTYKDRVSGITGNDTDLGF